MSRHETLSSCQGWDGELRVNFVLHAAIQFRQSGGANCDRERQITHSS